MQSFFPSSPFLILQPSLLLILTSVTMIDSDIGFTACRSHCNEGSNPDNNGHKSRQALYKLKKTDRIAAKYVQGKSLDTMNAHDADMTSRSCLFYISRSCPSPILLSTPTQYSAYRSSSVQLAQGARSTAKGSSSPPTRRRYFDPIHCSWQQLLSSQILANQETKPSHQ